MLLRSSILVLLAALLAAKAETQYHIDPDSVSLSTREMWCDSQKNSCPLICGQTKPGTTLVNDCDPKSLTYGCLCGNNLKPNMSEYSLTLPYFVCQEWGNQCVAACSHGDNRCQSDCREKHPCGALNPTRVTSTSSAGPSATQSDDDTAIYTSSPGGSSDDGKGAATALAAGRVYGLAVVFGGMFFGFALL